MSKEEKMQEEQKRSYTWKGEDGKEITKFIDDLKPEEVAALERLNNLNINIARLNAELSDHSILADYYSKIAEKAFSEEEE
tara:strand:- start:128 stop:370 length:243 start_codon:yes stop_codon:yes gene_type:complete